MSLPPIHPALVHFPIAFVLLSVITDVLGRAAGNERLRAVGYWSLVAAALGGALTIGFGYYDMRRAALSHQTHELVHLHLRIGWTLAAALVLLLLWRWRFWRRPGTRLSIPYLVCGSLVLLLTLFQGWFGGEMVYSHGAGVAAAGQGTEPVGQAQQRLATVTDALLPGASATGGTGPQEETEHGHGAEEPNHSRSHSH